MSPDSSDSLYLRQLTYKKKDGKTWLIFFISHFRITVLIVISIIAWGLYSLSVLPLESNPEVKIPFGIVTVALPGASPASMEDLVVKKIEKKVANLSGVKQVTATALNSFGSVTVEFRAEEDLKDALRRLRDAVDSVKSELPEDALEPVVSEISFSAIPVWTVVVTGPYENFTLREFADRVKDELEKLPGTSEVTVSGGDEREIRIFFDPQKLQRFSLPLEAVLGQIKASNSAVPLGTLRISNFEYTLQVDGKLRTIEMLRDMPIPLFTGGAIRLRDVATVREQAATRDVMNLFSMNGGPAHGAVTLNVVKKTGSSIIELIDGGQEKIRGLKKNLPPQLTIETTLDVSQIIRRDISQLKNDGLLTVAFVTLVLFLFVGLKEAFVAGLAVPLVFCATFGVMNLAGISLNFLSLFSLILSLGLLVDDAIVVVQATKQYLKTGKFTPEEAVLLVFRDYKVLLTTTTLTTIWAFIPLILATGIIGQFIRSIPLTVSVTLASSFIIAIIINHPMAIILERFRLTRAFFYLLFAALSAAAVFGIALNNLFIAIPSLGLLVCFFVWYRYSLKLELVINERRIMEERADPEKIKAKIRHHYLDEGEKTTVSKLINGIIRLEKIIGRYGDILRRLLESKKKSAVVLGIIAVLFFASLSLPATGILKSEFIPPEDAEYLYINVEGPQGLIAERTREITDRVRTVLLREPAIKNYSLAIGSRGVDIGNSPTGGGSGMGGQSNFAQFAINLHPYEKRPKNAATSRVEKSYEIAARIRKEVTPIVGGMIRVVELAGGPPTGADFEAQILGPDLIELQRHANALKERLEKIPGAINVATSIRLSPGEFSFVLKPDQMAQKGVNAAQIAGALRTTISGAKITTISEGEEEITVRAEAAAQRIADIDSLKSLTLIGSRGQPVVLGEVAEVKLASSLTSISRIDQKRAIVLSASAEKPHLPAEILAAFQKQMKEYALPNEYEIRYGGQNDENRESVISVLRAMAVAMILIIGTLVIQFNSFRKAMLVLATIPLALTGVFIGLTAIGFTLTFPGLIGILALFGIVVKNAVILVDKINLNLRVGISFVDAIVDASQSRLEAIFLTSICTIIGIIPLTVANEVWAGLGMSLIFGLAASTFLTLFVIPILYNLLVRKSYLKAQELENLKRSVEIK